MTPEMRYMLANARILALADVQNWTAQDLQDVFFLTSPSVPFEEWAKRIQPGQPQQAPAANPAPTPEDPDPETTQTMQTLLGPKGRQLQDLGILTIEETPNP